MWQACILNPKGDIQRWKDLTLEVCQLIEQYEPYYQLPQEHPKRPMTTIAYTGPFTWDTYLKVLQPINHNHYEDPKTGERVFWLLEKYHERAFLIRIFAPHFTYSPTERYVEELTGFMYDHWLKRLSLGFVTEEVSDQSEGSPDTDPRKSQELPPPSSHKPEWQWWDDEGKRHQRQY